jgi:SAM-dependent methyltransferase
MFDGTWQKINCLDIACNQGWFSSQIAIRGAHQVTGIDIRENHIKMANTIKNIADLKNLNFKVQDFLETDAISEKYDLVLFMGILYHLDNPLQAIRKIRSLTKKLCVIETQVAKPNPEMECCWGSDPQNRKGPALALIESDKWHVGPNKPLVLVPTLNALYRMLYASGFDHLFLGIPTESMEDQFLNYDRVIIFAMVDD